MKSASDKPLIVYPNSGECYDSPSGQWLKENFNEEASLKELLPLWREAGATVIGGCCRTDENYVKIIRKYADVANSLLN